MVTMPEERSSPWDRGPACWHTSPPGSRRPEHGARLQLQDDVSFRCRPRRPRRSRPRGSPRSRSCRTSSPVLPDVVGVDLHDALAVLVAAGQGEHPARLVVLDLDLRVDAQVRVPVPAAQRPPAPRIRSEGLSARQPGKRPLQRVFFSFSCGLLLSMRLDWPLSCLTSIEYGGGLGKPGCAGNFF